MWQHFKKVILAGLLAIAPIALTYWILKITFEFLDNFTAPILRKVHIDIPGLGLLLTLSLVYALGLFVTNVLGKKLFSWGERILTNIPIVKSIYSTIKQITQTFSGTASRNFQSVIYLEYPRKRLWTLAFVTGSSTNEKKDGFYHLFIPTTPNPTSGFFIIVPQEDTIPAEMNVEEALKAVISGGMLAPENHKII
jgi:uncharacterized membrane protein